MKAVDEAQNGIWFAIGAMHGRAAKLVELRSKILDDEAAARLVVPEGSKALEWHAEALQRAAAELVAVARWLNDALAPELRIPAENMAELRETLGIVDVPEIVLVGEDLG